MHEQLQALWNSRDREQPCVSGRLLTRSSSDNNRVDNCGNDSNILITEKWFSLVGHVLFFCKSEGSTEYCGVYLTDLFAPALARVDQKVLDEFDIPAGKQVGLALI